MKTCIVCGQPSYRRRFCKPDCYLAYPDGREARPGPGIGAFTVPDIITGEPVPA